MFRSGLEQEKFKAIFLTPFCGDGLKEESIAEWLGIAHWASLGVWGWQSTLIYFSDGDSLEEEANSKVKSTKCSVHNR